MLAGGRVHHYATRVQQDLAYNRGKQNVSSSFLLTFWLQFLGHSPKGVAKIGRGAVLEGSLLPACQSRGVGVEGGEVGGGWRWGHKLIWVGRPHLRLLCILRCGPRLLLRRKGTMRTDFCYWGSTLYHSPVLHMSLLWWSNDWWSLWIQVFKHHKHLETSNYIMALK